MEDKYSEVFEVECGIPQGSVLSPVLFSLFINDILDTKPQGVQFSIYADDVAMWYRHENQETSNVVMYSIL